MMGESIHASVDGEIRPCNCTVASQRATLRKGGPLTYEDLHRMTGAGPVIKCADATRIGANYKLPLTAVRLNCFGT